MEKMIDVISFLGEIVRENTQLYQSDFDYDKAKLQAAAQEPEQENRTLLWMSRPCGTWCFWEREVFLRDSLAHNVWTSSYYEEEAHKIKAYRVVLAPGQSGGPVLGTIQPLNYSEQIQRVKRNSVDVDTVDVTFADGEVCSLAYMEYRIRADILIAAHGRVEKIHYRPEHEEMLVQALQAERTISAVKKRPRQPRKQPSR